MATEHENNIIHIQNLIAVAYADGSLDEAEEEFLYDIAEDFEIDFKLVDDLLKKASTLEFIVPESQEDKEEQLVNIVFMSMLDGDFHESEYAICLDVAKRLGLTKSDLDEAVKLTKNLWDKA